MSSKNKQTIIISITGSIAAFKILDLIKNLQKNYNIEVIITKNAKKLIDLNNFKKIVKVHESLFNKNYTYKDYLKREKINHISLADKANLIIIAPATANIIGKVANGIADDLLSATIMASKAKILFAPAMNNNMYTNNIVQENIKKLKKINYNFIGPATGRLACNKKGIGRLSDIKDIAQYARNLLEQPLKNKKVLITAGPTQEVIDPVRFLSNKSSGKMGYALAKTAKSMGAQVTLISGPTQIAKPDVRIIDVISAKDMYKQTIKHYKNQDIIICCGAVADYTVKAKKNKIKKQKNKTLTLYLKRTSDIILELSKLKNNKQKLIAFALETENVVANAKAKFKNKKCDLIIANSDKALDSAFNQVFIITKKNTKKLPKISKIKLAYMLLHHINKLKI